MAAAVGAAAGASCSGAARLRPAGSSARRVLLQVSRRPQAAPDRAAAANSDGAAATATSRRRALAAVAAAAPLLLLPPSGLAGAAGSSVVTAEGAATAVEESSAVDSPYSLQDFRTADGSVRLRTPVGWTQVPGLDPSGSIVASFYNPDLPGADVIAVYRSTPAPGSTSTSAAFGSPEAYARALASVAPNGYLQEWGQRVGGGGSSESGSGESDGGGIVIYTARCIFGGNTAGNFGSAMELRAAAVVPPRGPRPAAQFVLRATTTRYKWLSDAGARRMLREVVAAFAVAPPR
jgi:hypothetical protein